eukprot:4545259-Pyramimonas_sp.AAC.1
MYLRRPPPVSTAPALGKNLSGDFAERPHKIRTPHARSNSASAPRLPCSGPYAPSAEDESYPSETGFGSGRRVIPCEIGDGMGDVVVGHSEDGELRDGALAALDTPGALVDGRQIRVHVPGVAATARHLRRGTPAGAARGGGPKLYEPDTKPAFLRVDASGTPPFLYTNRQSTSGYSIHVVYFGTTIRQGNILWTRDKNHVGRVGDADKGLGHAPRIRAIVEARKTPRRAVLTYCTTTTCRRYERWISERLDVALGARAAAGLHSHAWRLAHLLAGGGHLAQRVGVGGHVGKDDEHVLAAFIGEVLGGGQGNARRDDALDGRVIGQVKEQHRALHRPVLLEILLIHATAND